MAKKKKRWQQKQKVHSIGKKKNQKEEEISVKAVSSVSSLLSYPGMGEILISIKRSLQGMKKRRTDD